MKKLLLFIAACLISSAAFAQSPYPGKYGRWFCNWCSITGQQVGVDVGSNSEAIAFLKSTINNKVLRWDFGDTVDICDGVTCIQIQYTGWNLWIFRVNYPDPRAGYKNSTTTGSLYNFPNSSSNAIYYSVYGHWEYTDYYTSINGGVWRYNGTDATFVVDSLVTYNYMMGSTSGSGRKVPIY